MERNTQQQERDVATMSTVDDSRMVAALDIGTTKIVATLGRRNNNGRLQILGFSKALSKGIRKGEILNPEEASKVIRQVVDDLERKTGYTIKNVFTGIAGEHIRLIKHRTHFNLSRNDETVRPEDVKRLREDASRIGLEAGKEILHIIPQNYTLDNETDILNPIGMMGKRLEANFNVIVGNIDSIKRITHCVEQAGLNIHEIILEPLASSEAVLYPAEKEVGVALVDIGGGTTDVAVFYNNTLRYSSVIPFGGNIITQDIRSTCGMMEQTAEELKVQHGEALAEQTDENKVIIIPSEIPGRAKREVSVRHLAGIIQARMEEIIDMIIFHINNSECAGNLGSGIVITGGGAMLKHLKQLCTYQTGMDVNIGCPGQHLTGESDSMNEPLFATAVGLLKKGFDSLTEHPEYETAEKKDDSSAEPTLKARSKKRERKTEQESKIVDKVLSAINIWFGDDADPKMQ